MTYCVKCGAPVEDGIGICPQCGAAIPDAFGTDGRHQESGYAYGNDSQDKAQGQQYTYDQSYTYDYDPEVFPEEEVKKNKAMGVLAYLGILLLIQILAGDMRSDYIKQHCSQGIVLFVLKVVVNVMEWLSGHVFLVGGVLSWGVDIAEFACFIIMIMGIVSAVKGTRKPVPILSAVRIYK